jgi:hypothetical protein
MLIVGLLETCGCIIHHRREVCTDHYRQLQASEVLAKLSTMTVKSSFLKVPVVITKQLKLYLNNSSRTPTLSFNSVVESCGGIQRGL